MQQLGGSLMTPEYAQNSGLLGSLAMMAQAYAGKKMSERAGKDDAAARERYYKGEAALKDAEAQREAQRKRDAEVATRSENESILRSGDPIKIAAAGLKMPDQGGPEYDLREVGGKLYYVPKQPMAQGSPQGNTPTQDASFDMLREAVKWQESRGNPNAVSPKGAVGTMQTMPGTLRDPGYGVDPARDNSPQELERVGVDYLRAMTGKYGQVGGLAAYNWGPGNWERALEAAGGDPERALAMAPAETQQYVPSVLQRVQGGAGMGFGTQAMQVPGGAIPVPGIPDSIPTRDAPSGYMWGPDGKSLIPIPGGPADRKNNPVPADNARNEMSMRKELESDNKNDNVVVSQYKNLRTVAANPSAANDLAMIFSYMKMLDPGSVVREQEFANAQNAAGVPDRVRVAWNKALSGERLSEEQRNRFLESARSMYDQANIRIHQRTSTQADIARQYGYDPVRSTGNRAYSESGIQNQQRGLKLLREARDAIQKGADKALVARRLSERGFPGLAERL